MFLEFREERSENPRGIEHVFFFFIRQPWKFNENPKAPRKRENIDIEKTHANYSALYSTFEF